MLELVASLAIASALVVMPDGGRLREGGVCYTMSVGDKPIGQTWQSVRAGEFDGADVWEVTVHQRTFDGSFDLRDDFVLRRSDLRPIFMSSEKFGSEHVRVYYHADRAETLRHGDEPSAAQLPAAVWDGNLWGLTFAALPLKEGAHFDLPFYHYDKGTGSFSLDVVGSEDVEGRAAWIVEADAGGGRKARYLISKDTAEELRYSGGPMVQSKGGDCGLIAGD